MAKSKSRKKKIKQSVSALMLIAAALILLLALWALDRSGLFTYENLTETAGLSSTPVSSSTSVHFIDVGQGDCTLIISDGKTLLIDAGEKENGSKVCSYLKSQNITRLDYIIATHPHSDHIGGLPDVIGEFEVGAVIAPVIPDKLVPTSKSYENFLSAVSAEGCGLTKAKAGDVYSLGGSSFEIIAPLTDDSDDLNNYSVVCLLTYGDNIMLFTGDASKDEENDILDSGKYIDADLLKVGHHGSSSSSVKKFLNAVTPDYCVIMCGVDNSYNHPNEKTVERLEKYTDKINRTDLQGTIVCIPDGKGNYSFTFENGE